MSGESDSDFLDRLAPSIADGNSIDWDKELAQLGPDEKLKRLLDVLRMLDGVAGVHRSDLDAPLAESPGIASPEPTEPPTPDGGIGQWGKFVLFRKIGEGGFGVVYHAHDPNLEHSVALKLFKPRATNRESAVRILHEARKLARIRHPNVVIVHGADSHNGQPGFWMDLIEGTTLEHIVRGGRLSAREATTIGQEVCGALAAVHHAGIVHRDVKAQNVMRATDGGRIILMDFGAGEFMKDEREDVRKQGTPLYLAPELFNGANGSARSDIYAAGVLLYYLVTADFPIRGASIEDLKKAHQRGERRRLRDVRPDLPTQFVSIVERALDRDPEARFATAGEMEDALARQSLPMPTVPIPVPVVSSNRLTLQNIAIGVASVFMATAIIGWIACRIFERGVGVPSDLVAGPVDYLSVGATALLPFGIFWSLFAGLVAILGSLGRPFRRRFAAIRARISASRSSVDGATIAILVPLTGFACWLAISWQYEQVVLALYHFMLKAPISDAELSILGSAGRLLHRNHFLSSAYLSFLLGLAVWRWFPRLEHNATDPDTVRLLKWATVVVIALVIASATASRRLVWEEHELATFDNRPSFVIGSSSDELLLYHPYSDPPKHRRVRRDDPTLHRTGSLSMLFDRH